MIQAVFFDRDGTFSNEVRLEYPEEFKPFPFVRKVVARIKEHGIKVFMFTNQPNIDRGRAKNYDYAKEFREHGADDWFMCPHLHEAGCDCRKPRNGLLKQAQVKYQLDLQKCVVVGDRWTDMEAGLSVGARAILVRTGMGAECEHNEQAEHYLPLVDAICDTIVEAADVILKMNEETE